MTGMSFFGFGSADKKDGDKPSQGEGPGFVTEAMIEGLLLASGGGVAALAGMLISHGLGRDPALWVYLQRKLGNQKTREIHDQVDPAKQAQPTPVAPDRKPEAPDYKGFCTQFTTVFTKCMSGFPGGMTEELVPQYFTAPQIADLTAFMSSNVVPPNLFHQKSGDKLTSQQRILMAGVMLANGTLPPELESADNLGRDPLRDDKGKETKTKAGTHDNKLHATMCGHWAQQVYLYAGANLARDNKQSLETVDSGGTLHLGNAVADKSPFGLHADKTGLQLEGKQKDAAEAQEAKEAQEKADAEAKGEVYKPKNHMSYFRHAEMGPEVFEALQPGDWIYIYNANADASGEHSEIFIGWADDKPQPLKDNPDIQYRTANVMSQMMVGDGGKTHPQKIGTAYAPGVAPVTSIVRTTEKSGELVDVNSLVSSSAVASNEKIIADKKLDAKKLHDFLVDKAGAELVALVAKKLDAKQQALFQKAIDGATGEASPQALALLVACVQRLDLASGNLFAARTANGIIDGTMLADKAKFAAG